MYMDAYTYMHSHICIYMNIYLKVFGKKGLHGIVSVRTSAKIISENDIAQLIYDSGTFTFILVYNVTNKLF